ncbi:MAG: alcohol dehydrogenase catalytic domain-containing protein [Deltaproteobacteria bacterium]|nr:alcohol dehydrogenase catalytic domain-containing protein [Deltaproteobacteria bacterium]
MRAMVLTGHGGPDKLQMQELPDPVPKAHEVRVRVKACALNHLDLFVREGWPKLKLELPHVLGSDVAGVVDLAGAEASDLPAGTPVMVNPGVSCGACRECLSGRDNRCRGYHILGEHSRGGYAQ